jgi:hypothetical protein
VPDLRDYALGAAKRNGVPMDLFERQISQESGFSPKAYNAKSGATGIAQIIPRWHPGVDPTDPIASLDYAAKWMADLRRIYGSWRAALAAYNWGPANVAKWDGQRETLPEETRHYLDVILGDGWPEPAQILSAEKRNPPLRVSEDGVRLRSGPGTDTAILATLRAGTEAVPVTDHAWRQVRVGEQSGWVAADYLDASGFGTASEQQTVQSARVFDPTTPAEIQRQPWTCAIRSTMWLLKSIGIQVSPDEAQDAMSPRYVTPELGLLDATGAGIVAVLRDRWGVAAENHASVTFDQIAAWAGRMPVAIGGRNWHGPSQAHCSRVSEASP